MNINIVLSLFYVVYSDVALHDDNLKELSKISLRVSSKIAVIYSAEILKSANLGILGGTCSPVQFPSAVLSPHKDYGLFALFSKMLASVPLYNYVRPRDCHFYLCSLAKSYVVEFSLLLTLEYCYVSGSDRCDPPDARCGELYPTRMSWIHMS